MRLAVFSDLHIEQRMPYVMPKVLPPFDVAVAAGDIDGSCRNAVEALAGMPALRDSPIVYVCGNHEHYRKVFQDNIADGIEAALGTNVHLLHRGEVVIHRVRFVGATLWTDYDLDGDAGYAMALANRYMNDHAIIEYRREDGTIDLFSPADALAEHRKDLAFIRKTLATPHAGPTVVFTHHLPSRRSIAPQFASSSLNPSFASDLDHLIQDYQPDLWIHGHTHHLCDYMIGMTRVLCNPKGYGPANGQVLHENRKFDPRLIVQIGDRQPKDDMSL